MSFMMLPPPTPYDYPWLPADERERLRQLYLKELAEYGREQDFHLWSMAAAVAVGIAMMVGVTAWEMLK